LRLSRGGAFIEPDAFHIKTGDYPFAHNLYLYTQEKKSPLELQFIKLAYSPVGQRLLEQSGFVSTLATRQASGQASTEKQRLLDDSKVPTAYKDLIRNAERGETPYNLRFESGTGQLDNKSLIDLGRLVQSLQEQRGKNTTVVLIGFSDSRGDPPVNLKLSIDRAQFVADVLQTQGIDRIEVAGFGEEPGLLLNPQEKSYEALKDNRRVEVWLKR
jgi:phosphate transport system substrate-binding protein